MPILTKPSNKPVNGEFKVNDLDDTTTTSVLYVGKERGRGEWEVSKIDDTTSTTSIGYATLRNNPTITSYDAAWAAILTLNYANFSES